MNEKVRIYHHNLHKNSQKKSSILKLLTPGGLVEGHVACARALEENVAAHLLHPATIDLQAQAILLGEVDTCFTDEDNKMLLKIPNKGEIKGILFLPGGVLPTL